MSKEIDDLTADFLRRTEPLMNDMARERGRLEARGKLAFFLAVACWCVAALGIAAFVWSVS